MARKSAALTARAVATLKEPGMHGDGNGLYLKVTETETKSWVFRYQIAGRRRNMGLGEFPAVSLSDARQRAAAGRQLLEAGIDPLEHRAAEKCAAIQADERAKTFRQCADDFITSMAPSWRSAKHATQWRRSLELYVFPVIGSSAVEQVHVAQLLEILRPIWVGKTETASRVRSRIEQILDYAKAHGYRDGENPARWKGSLAHLLPAKGAVIDKGHYTSMPYAEMPAFWPKVQVSDGQGARALELTILTACRSAETFGARWDEIDLDARVWTIPAGRMKAGKEHRIPLSDPAMVLLRKMASIRQGDYVFTSVDIRRPISNMAMTMAMRRLKAPYTVHGFRSTFRTWVEECTDFPHAVAEAALAHTQRDKVVAAYQRGDLFAKRQLLMDAWAAYCLTGATPGTPTAGS